MLHNLTRLILVETQLTDVPYTMMMINCQGTKISTEVTRAHSSSSNKSCSLGFQDHYSVQDMACKLLLGL